MKNTNIFTGVKNLNQLLLVVFLLFSPLTLAYAACCAGHGGVASCNKSTGYQMCKDKTASPTCTCAISKPVAKPAAKPVAKPTAKPVVKPTAKPKAIKTPVSNTTIKAKPVKNVNSGTSAKGCCSRHGGIAQCNKSTGYQMCKDGSASPSCTCQ